MKLIGITATDDQPGDDVRSAALGATMGMGGARAHRPDDPDLDGYLKADLSI
ncbi:MAG TPA: hypothetical protein VFB06_35050 [Streptosporangiaceae bacterium]|nr:hypothetical protein [Streptosporangiaceae bacterium]